MAAPKFTTKLVAPQIGDVSIAQIMQSETTSDASKFLSGDGTARVPAGTGQPLPTKGTFTANGSTPVTVADTHVTADSAIVITLKTAAGTVSVSAPAIKTITVGVGFTVAALAADTSVYNYAIFG